MHIFWTRRRDGRPLLAATLAVIASLALAAPAVAAHPEVSLAGSDFEIDADANLKVDDGGSLDWANVGETRKLDTASGPDDESFGQGTKEDTAEPTVVDGSIPPNKSDLKFFGVYQEGDGGDGFLNLFWSRVQDPSGTTNMDFEFNRLRCAPEASPPDTANCSSNGITPLRSEGDLLIVYDLAKGGTVPILSIREWTGTAWGPATNLTSSSLATGSINTSSIPVGESDDLGAHSPRTFGEAQIALSAIFDPDECESFGSAYLKSRASDSFTAALKDFVPPEAIQLSNCGAINITKTDDTGALLGGAEFTVYESDGDADFEPGTGDPIAEDADGNQLVCTTDATTGTCGFVNVLFGDYWVDETGVPSGHSKAPGLPQQFSVTDTTVVELGPFANARQTGSIVVEKTDEAGAPLAGAEFALDADGDPDTTDDQTPIPLVAGEDARFCIDGLLFGSYTVVETVVPDGYTPRTLTRTASVSEASTCGDRVLDDPDLTFVNERLPGAIRILKTAKDVGAESGSSPLEGVEFTITDADGDEVGTVTTDDNGRACLGGLTVGATYTVTETDVPAGFVVDSSVTDDVTITDDATCAAGGGGDQVSFSNDPLSKITVTFESLAQGVDGGRTAATIDCSDASASALVASPPDGSPAAFNDTTEVFTNLEEGTYNCTVVIDP